MFLSIKFENGLVVNLVARYTTVQRLAKTCFRGSHLSRAGNFFSFDRAEDVIKELKDELLMDALDNIKNKSEDHQSETFSVTFDIDRMVGWESTDDIKAIPEDALERFHPNRKSAALRVKPERTDLKAPMTTLVTIIYELRREDSVWVVVIHSIYPGEDIGDLKGDITLRENRVFYSWSHPGA